MVLWAIVKSESQSPWITRSAAAQSLAQFFEENQTSLLPVAHDGARPDSPLRGDVFEGEAADETAHRSGCRIEDAAATRRHDCAAAAQQSSPPAHVMLRVPIPIYEVGVSLAKTSGMVRTAVTEPLTQVHKSVAGANCHRSLSVPHAPVESMP
jgi:hypothetical protein